MTLTVVIAPDLSSLIKTKNSIWYKSMHVVCIDYDRIYAYKSACEVLSVLARQAVGADKLQTYK